MMLSDSRFQDCPDTDSSTGAYIVFYQGGPIDHFIQVPGTVFKSSAESEYNVALNSGMDIAQFRIPNNELLNKDTDVVLEQAPLIILDRKPDMCMAKNGKDTKHTRHLSIK